jgi:hypothetical protein
MIVPLLSAEHHWSCPNCEATKLTREARPHTPFHPCRGLAGLMVPFVPDGTDCKVEAVEREDYTNGDLVQVDGNGRVIMAASITRDDGEDRVVYAPTATAKGSR